MASPFLENLKNAVDKGEFNSDAAKKINEIDKLADEKFDAFASVNDRIDKAGYVESVTEEEAALSSAEYDKKMEEIKKQDAINKQAATLMEIEDMVLASILDMFTFIVELETKFEKELESKDPIFVELIQQIEKIKSKYNSIINN